MCSFIQNQTLIPENALFIPYFTFFVKVLYNHINKNESGMMQKKSIVHNRWNLNGTFTGVFVQQISLQKQNY